MPTLKPLHLAAYIATGLLLSFYALVLWWMAHPNVSDNFRAYYIDQSSTCLDQPVAGTYTLGQLVSFRSDGYEAARTMKPCGWEGPAGDGTHAVGTSSRVRFSYEQPATGALNLSLDMVAVRKDNAVVPQSVGVVVNGDRLATVEVPTGDDQPQHFDIRIPAAAALAANGRIDLLLEFPDAVNMGKSDPPSRWRSIKLLAAGLLPTT